eukprot:2329084-Prymnesium_polylepis.1
MLVSLRAAADAGVGGKSPRGAKAKKGKGKGKAPAGPLMVSTALVAECVQLADEYRPLAEVTWLATDVVCGAAASEAAGCSLDAFCVQLRRCGALLLHDRRMGGRAHRARAHRGRAHSERAHRGRDSTGTAARVQPTPLLIARACPRLLLRQIPRPALARALRARSIRNGRGARRGSAAKAGRRLGPPMPHGGAARLRLRLRLDSTPTALHTSATP